MKLGGGGVGFIGENLGRAKKVKIFNFVPFFTGLFFIMGFQ
jgi:hypothetical protein